MSAASASRQGLLSALGNPKLAVFFVSLFPQFVTPAPGAAIGMLLLGGCFGAMTLGWLSLYAFAIGRGSDVLIRAGVRRWIQGVTGAVLVAFGVRLATEAR
jgi:threonine/homoserine/homoserine lactone efflux protein